MNCASLKNIYIHLMLCGLHLKRSVMSKKGSIVKSAFQTLKVCILCQFAPVASPLGVSSTTLERPPINSGGGREEEEPATSRSARQRGSLPLGVTLCVRYRVRDNWKCGGGMPSYKRRGKSRGKQEMVQYATVTIASSSLIAAAVPLYCYGILARPPSAEDLPRTHSWGTI